jgi:hypothetical protein
MAYNTRNIYANGITERVDGGLSLLGQKLVKACNEARLIVDVSHTAEKSALDTIEASSEPVIMSHANARGQIDSPRNVSDDLIKAIAANGGFVGAVAYPAFVSKNQKPTMDDMVAMIDYMVQLVGPDHVTMGLDYDATTFGVMDEAKVEAIYNNVGCKRRLGSLRVSAAALLLSRGHGKAKHPVQPDRRAAGPWLQRRGPRQDLGRQLAARHGRGLGRSDGRGDCYGGNPVPPALMTEWSGGSCV